MAIFDNPSREILKGAEVVAKLISLSYGAQQNNILYSADQGSHTLSQPSPFVMRSDSKTR